MIELEKYGFSNFYLKDVEINEDLIPARIVEIQRNLFKIVSKYGEGNANLSGSLFNSINLTDEFPAVGDFVLIKYNEYGDSSIVKVLPRKSKFSRPDYSGHAVGYVKTILEQIVAANFDYVFILTSLNNDFNLNRVLRYVTATWESGAIPVVLLTKADLVDSYEEQMLAIQKNAFGVDVIAISSVTGLGLDKLSIYLKPGKTLVFLGSSGVGKSSLVNKLADEEIMDVNSIREDDSKGRHTTTHRQLILLKNGVIIIDTPGMRELGMWYNTQGLSETFSDIEELISKCKFSDCTHTNEPKCAIKEALNNGTLEYSRWKNYLKLKHEVRFTKDKTTYIKNKDNFKKFDKDKNKFKSY